jgi:two-component system, NtrC family, sensor histidine kinase HydH
MQDYPLAAAPIEGITPSYDLTRQQTAFCVLTLFVLAMLLLLHIMFAYVLGEPSLPVVVVLGLSFGLRLIELGWLQSHNEPLSERAAKTDGTLSILSLFLLAFLLAWLTNRDHSPYQVLLVIPVLQSACLFGLVATAATIVFADATIFIWLRHYFALYPQPSGKEYLEAGMLAVIIALVGVLMWLLMRLLRAHQAALAGTLSALQTAREKLMSEEKLAAIGRLASGIAHEIRNPVAMIASALTTAADPLTVEKERDEMFAIADRQAKRLEILTTEFLSYAKPSPPRRSPILVSDLLSAIEAVTRVKGDQFGIQLDCEDTTHRTASLDVAQVEGALLNLTLNAIDAMAASGNITVRAATENGALRIDVENCGHPIAETHLARIFEPFFTTKPGGTGLGLAVARGVARAHGGDLWVSNNEEGRVRFTMILAGALEEQTEQEVLRA